MPKNKIPLWNVSVNRSNPICLKLGIPFNGFPSASSVPLW
jgi:hypothetical protein